VRFLEPVGGQDYGTTAEMPDLQTVIDYEENRCRLSWGYYRMVDRPALYEWQQSLLAETQGCKSPGFCFCAKCFARVDRFPT
jgi:hypothetical protein